MSTVQVVTKVWIAPGCIVCDACETTAPTVFEVKHDDATCIIRPEALEAEFCKPLTPDIIQAAEECPVDVIKFETVEVPADQAPKFVSSVAPAAAVKAAPHAPPGGEPAADATAAAAKVSPEAPAAPGPDAPGKPPAKHAPARPPSTDPAIAALLAAATFRGGAATLLKPTTDLPRPVKEIQKLSPDKLPPDARHVKVIEKSRPKPPEQITRRDLVLAGAWLAFGAGVGGPSLLAFQRFMMPNVLEEPDPKVRCGLLARFANMQPGDVNEDFKNTGRFWIIREEERIAALSIICTHLGCIPSWLPNDRKFKCPCHGSGFKQNGTNFEGPAPRPLERFKIQVENGEVVVDRSRKFLAMGPNDTGVWTDPDASIAV